MRHRYHGHIRVGGQPCAADPVFASLSRWDACALRKHDDPESLLQTIFALFNDLLQGFLPDFLSMAIGLVMASPQPKMGCAVIPFSAPTPAAEKFSGKPVFPMRIDAWRARCLGFRDIFCADDSIADAAYVAQQKQHDQCPAGSDAVTMMRR